MIVALFLLCIAAAALADDCRLHRYDKYDIRACSDLDYAVCASDGRERDQQILDRYVALQSANPQPSAECIKWWLLVECSAAFHWSSRVPFVCERTCSRFYRVCSPYGVTINETYCGVDSQSRLGNRCRDYASNTECRECTTVAAENDSERVAWLRERERYLKSDAAESNPSALECAIVGALWLAFVQ